MNLNQSLSWGIAEAKDHTANIMIGIPRECWQTMAETGASTVIDLTKHGFPTRVIIYACETYDDGEKQLTETFTELKAPVKKLT